MKIVACYALHYGVEYLAWSIRSIAEIVDEVRVFYAPEPSYGFVGSGLVCPDSEEALQVEARRFLPPSIPIVWTVGRWRTEGAHKGELYRSALADGADVLVCLDADEVWPGVEACVRAMRDANCAGRWSARFLNFWRSLDWEVRDHFRPIRLVDARHPLTVDADLGDAQPQPILHGGYAQTEATTAYKLSIHGHLAEFRGGWRGWFESKFLPWSPAVAASLEDLHPCVVRLWDRAHQVSEVDRALVAAHLGDHPYFGKEIVR